MVILLRLPASERGQALQRDLVAAVAAGEETRDAADRRDRHAGELVNLAIGQAVLEVLHDGPPVDERLDLHGRAEVREELLALGFRAQAQDRAVKTLLGARRGACRQTPMSLHRSAA